MKPACDCEAMAARLHRLEANARRWKLVGLLMWAGLGAVLIPGRAGSQDATPRTVRAQSYEITDAAGVTRGVLGVTAGSPSLALLDESGTIRVMLGILPDGSSHLHFDGPDKQTRMSLVASSDGLSALSFMDKKGANRLLSRVDSDGSPSVGLYGLNGKKRMDLYLSGEDSPFLSLHDDQQKPRAVLSAFRSMAFRGETLPGLAFTDSAGEIRAYLGIGVEDAPYMRLNAADGKRRVIRP